MDCRVIGERSDAVLRTARPGNDGGGEDAMTMLLRLLGVAITALAIPLPALAQPAPYPTRNVEIIVPYGPGGSTDIVARIVAQNLQDRLGQSFVVLNRPGASGTLGLTAAMRANP